MDKTELITSVHEVGHALVAAVLKVSSGGTTIIPYFSIFDMIKGVNSSF